MTRSLLVLAIVLAACGDTDEPARTQEQPEASSTAVPGIEAASLVGGTWEIDAFTSGGNPIELFSPRGQPGSLRFEANGMITGYDGCNSLGYGMTGPEAEPEGLTYEVIGDEIRFTGTSGSTLKACRENGYQERYRALLIGPLTHHIDGNTLTITAASGDGATLTAKP